MDELDKNEVKAAMKEAIHEWLDDKFLAFGKWSAAGVAAMSLGALAYFILTLNGWHK